MRFIIGVDIGGTFTDSVALKVPDDGSATVVKIGKASSTPPDFQTGFIGALSRAAEMHGVALGEMLANAQVYHGCTVGTNALVEHKTARAGYLASRGHVDSIFIMKAGGRLKWMPADYIAHVAKQTKPEPLVPKSLCEGIDERVAFDGRIVAPLNEARAREAIRRIVDQGVEAIAISLLWSTANDTHERRLREMVKEIAPDVFVSISSEVSPRVGEYERSIATIVNAIIGPPMRHYLQALEVDLKRHGYTRSLQEPGAMLPTERDLVRTTGLSCTAKVWTNQLLDRSGALKTSVKILTWRSAFTCARRHRIRIQSGSQDEMLHSQLSP